MASNSDAKKPPAVKIVTELFQDYNELGYKQALRELDVALVEKWQFIVVEPLRLGDETARWIAVGNFLHRFTVMGSVSTVILTLGAPRLWYLYGSLLAGCSFTFGTYVLSWQGDPCCKYQVETDTTQLSKLELETQSISNGSVVVLRYADDQKRKMLHTFLFGLATVCVVYRGYRVWKGD